jgi:hypothetical protein
MAVMAENTAKVWVTNCLSYSYWFERFMRGVYKRMGEMVHSDFALSIQVVHKMLGHLDDEWNKARTLVKRKEIVEIACFFYCLFAWVCMEKKWLKWILLIYDIF